MVAAPVSASPSLPGMDAPLFAALDLGTNNCRLLIARPTNAGFKVVDSFSRITRLGEGLRASGRLSRGAMDRTVSALSVCAQRMSRHQVRVSRCVATAACRAAENVADFASRVESETGLVLDIIPPEEEARLALAGCAPLLETAKPYALVFDIGGGSTELTLVRVPTDPEADPTVIALDSLPLGVVTMAEAVGGGHLSERLHGDIVQHVGERLRPFALEADLGRLAARGELALLGTSGTVTTIGAVALGLHRYDRGRVDGLRLPITQVRAISADLLTMSPADRAAHPCIGRDRADLVLAGCAILEAILRAAEVDGLRVADRGIREGVLMDLMGTPGPGEFSDETCGASAPTDMLGVDRDLPPCARTAATRAPAAPASPVSDSVQGDPSHASS